MQDEHEYPPASVPPTEQFDRQPEFNPQPSPEPSAPRFSKKRLILVVIGFFVLGGIGFAVALIQENSSQKQPAATNQTNANSEENQTNSNEDVPNVAATKTFKADFPRVEFTYPENWKVTENTEQEGIRIESPDFNYTSINGNKISGNFRIYIRQGARQQDGKYIGRGVAAVDSEKLVYSAPASEQRPETNLSFFGLDSADNFAYFLIAGNFSLKKGESLGPDYGRESETYIIAGGYSSNELTEDLATNPVPVEYFATTNAYKQAMEILRSMKII